MSHLKNKTITSKEYIISELKTLVKDFPNVRVRYEYDSRALVHCVEVVPREMYHSSDEYISWENEMTDRFIQRFSGQNVCFVSDDAYVGVKNAEFTLYGDSFAPASTTKEAATVAQEAPAKRRKRKELQPV
ncbi:MAG: hypothetical protein LBT94_04810 [Prevotellaceae bacterium]|jgi:hypothetical protein|nr:hypothetical protein [Prevotellaceae bacterium]